MGNLNSYKPMKRKRDEVKKRFVNVDMVLKLIRDNEDKLLSSNVQIEERDIEYGDEWYSESGFEYLIFFPDKSAYLVGKIYITEDDENWAQAEGYESHRCSDYYTQESIKPIELMEKLEKYV